MSWKKLLEKFQEGCLVHDHRLYLSGMKEAFLSHFWPDTSNQVSTHTGHTVWRKMLFYVYQYCCLVLGQPDI